MSILGWVGVAGRSRSSRSVGGQSGLIDGTEYRSRNSCRDIGYGQILVDETWTTTGARERDGQRPDRHQPSSLRAGVEIVLCPCVLWLNFSWRGRYAWKCPA